MSGRWPKMAPTLPGDVEPRFVHTFTVPFDDADAAGIVFFARTYFYAHRAYEAFIRSIEIHDFFSPERFVCPFVHTEADHKNPMRPGEVLDVEVRLEKLGTSSMTFVYRIMAGTTEKAEVRMVSVFVDPLTFTKIPIPDDIRAALQA